jgi:predicted transcriptional regulator of viral defense system
VQLVLTKLVQQIREEFEDASGLRVTVREASQFFGLDLEVCREVLAELNRAGFLTRHVDGRYGCTPALIGRS